MEVEMLNETNPNFYFKITRLIRQQTKQAKITKKTTSSDMKEKLRIRKHIAYKKMAYTKENYNKQTSMQIINTELQVDFKADLLLPFLNWRRLL